jgi:autotransporter-associated beta strand protein
LNDDTAYTFSFMPPNQTPGSIRIIVSGGGSNKVWAGGQPSAPTAWDYNTTSNWLAGLSQVKFFNRDWVTFDDTGLTNVVNLVSNLRPATVTFSNNTINYTLQGPARLYADAMTNSGTGVVTIANSAPINSLTAGGLFLNQGTLAFNQPVDATFNANLNGTNLNSGLAKLGPNQLTLTGNSAATFSSPIAVNNGTLQAGGANTFGFGKTTVSSGGSVDLNGQIMVSNTFALSGSGMSGVGAINNTGGQQTNAVQKIILNGDTTLGAISRWDMAPTANSSFQGNSNNLTKVGLGSIFLGPKHDTSVSNINVTAGELAFAWPGTDLGSVGSITVQSNATLAFAADIAAGSKPTTVMTGGKIGAELIQLGTGLPAYGSNNSYAGDITFVSTGIVNIATSAGLTLSGGLHGSNGLVNVARGSLTLSGNNDYSGGLIFNLGRGIIANSTAIPSNTFVSLDCQGAPGIDTVGLTITNNITTPASVPLNMISYNRPAGASFPTFGGNGTWNGAVNAIAVQTDDNQNCDVNINGGFPKLVLNGQITETGAKFMDLNLNGTMPGTIALNQPLVWRGQISLQDRNILISAGNPATNINTLELNAAGNSFTNFILGRGKLRIGTNNAYPSACTLIAIQNTGTDNYDDHRVIIDLNGHFQTFSNIAGLFGDGGSGNWIGSDNTNADSTVTFDCAGMLTNTWSCWIVDHLNTNLPAAGKTGLTVASGGLHLVTANYGSVYMTKPGWTASGPISNTYSGPTLIQGGVFQCDVPLYKSAVTVSGTATLKGTGPFFNPVIINSGASLAPGGGTTLDASPIVGPPMTVNSTLTLAPGSTTYMDVKATQPFTNDIVKGLTSITYGGTLVVTNQHGAYANGMVYPMFIAGAYSGNFASISPPAPATGLVWYTNTLPIDGKLRITNVVTTVPTLTRTVSGGNMTITWPLDHVGWRLQVQTNLLNVGLKTNSWVTVPGSTNIQSYVAPIVSTNPTVYYRLVYP